jgi:hypothetical protein
MSIFHKLEQKKEAIVQRWKESVFSLYPQGTAAFMRDGGDRFTNPAGCNISMAMSSIFDGLVDDKDITAQSRAVDEIVRLLAVQDMSPADAVSFPSMLKAAIIRELGSDSGTPGEWLQIDSRIDKLNLMAINTYELCREQINQLKLKEARAALLPRKGR